GRHAGAAPPGAARARAGPRARRARDDGGRAAPRLGRLAQAVRRPCLRARLGRQRRGRPRERRGGVSERLRIAVISPVWFPVPPTGYGGIEWVVWLLADGLADAGHDVTLFASGDSHTRAKLSSVFPVAPSERIGQTLPELHHALACFERAADFDVVNDHSGPPAAALGGAVRTPVVHTVHGPLDSIGG